MYCPNRSCYSHIDCCEQVVSSDCNLMLNYSIIFQFNCLFFFFCPPLVSVLAALQFWAMHYMQQCLCIHLDVQTQLRPQSTLLSKSSTRQHIHIPVQCSDAGVTNPPSLSAVLQQELSHCPLHLLDSPACIWSSRPGGWEREWKVVRRRWRGKACLIFFFLPFFSICALVAPTSFMVTAVKTWLDYSAPQS